MRAIAVADAAELAPEEALDEVRAQPTMDGAALVAQVSTPAPYVAHEAGRVPRGARRLRREALDRASGSRRRARRSRSSRT